MNNKLILASLSIFLWFEGLSQQFQWGPTVSFGVADLTSPVGDNVDVALLPSFSIGIATQHTLTKHLALRTGLRYTAKGTKKDMIYWDGFVETHVGSYRYKTSYAEIPLTLNLDFGKKHGFIVSGGVYYGIGLFGKEKIEPRNAPTISQSIKFQSTFDPNEDRLQLSPSDLGGIITIGHSWEKVIVDLGWNGSFSSVHALDDDDWKHTLLKFNITYFIPG